MFIWASVFIGRRLAQSCSFSVDEFDDSLLDGFVKVDDKKFKYDGGNYTIWVYVIDNIPGFWVSLNSIDLLIEWIEDMKRQYKNVEIWVGPTPWR